jgi:hypothetical protein
MYYVASILFSAIIFSGCEKDDIGEENEEEIITTMLLQFTPQGGGNMLEYSFDDPDGPGGANPTQSTITLAPNKTYDVEAILLNKTTNPIDTVSNDVEEESDAHRIYYLPSSGSNITVSNLDTDDAGVPLGLNGTWTTGATATGTIRVVLRHYANNPPGKAANDDVNSTKSSTDIDVTFSSAVQ